jgi:hypothetical protein
LNRKKLGEAEEGGTQIEAYYHGDVSPWTGSQMSIAQQKKSQDVAVIKAKMTYFEALIFRGRLQSVYQAAIARDNLYYNICLPEFERKIDFDEFETELLTAVAVEPVKRFVALNVMDDRGWHVLHDWFSTERITVLTDVVCMLLDGGLVDTSILIPETYFGPND